MYFTGKALYQAYADAQEHLGCAIDSWDDAGETEQRAWNLLAERLNEEPESIV